MTKQEQIEEMSKYICNVCEMGFSFNGDCSEGGQDYYKRCTLTQETAKALYDAGYHKTSDEFEKEVNRQEQIEEIEEVLINKNKYTGKDCTDCDHWFGSFCGAPIKCQAEAIYEAGYRNSPDKKIVFITVSEPKKERIIPEGEPIKDIGAEGALGKKGSAVRVFAEKVKEKALLHCRTINCYECKFIETMIDELLEEYENDKTRPNRRNGENH